MVNLTTSVKLFFYFSKILRLFFFNSDLYGFIFINITRTKQKVTKKILKKLRYIILIINSLKYFYSKIGFSL